jgi:hypothetical protein
LHRFGIHRSLISIVSLKIAELFADFFQNVANFVKILLNFAKFWPIFFGIFPKCSNFQILLKVEIKWLQICENLNFAHI